MKRNESLIISQGTFIPFDTDLHGDVAKRGSSKASKRRHLSKLIKSLDYRSNSGSPQPSSKRLRQSKEQQLMSNNADSINRKSTQSLPHQLSPSPHRQASIDSQNCVQRTSVGTGSHRRQFEIVVDENHADLWARYRISDLPFSVEQRKLKRLQRKLTGRQSSNFHLEGEPDSLTNKITSVDLPSILSKESKGLQVAPDANSRYPPIGTGSQISPFMQSQIELPNSNSEYTNTFNISIAHDTDEVSAVGPNLGIINPTLVQKKQKIPFPDPTFGLTNQSQSDLSQISFGGSHQKTPSVQSKNHSINNSQNKQFENFKAKGHHFASNETTLVNLNATATDDIIVESAQIHLKQNSGRGKDKEGGSYRPRSLNRQTQPAVSTQELMMLMKTNSQSKEKEIDKLEAFRQQLMRQISFGQQLGQEFGFGNLSKFFDRRRSKDETCKLNANFPNLGVGNKIHKNSNDNFKMMLQDSYQLPPQSDPYLPASFSSKQNMKRQTRNSLESWKSRSQSRMMNQSKTSVGNFTANEGSIDSSNKSQTRQKKSTASKTINGHPVFKDILQVASYLKQLRKQKQIEIKQQQKGENKDSPSKGKVQNFRRRQQNENKGAHSTNSNVDTSVIQRQTDVDVNAKSSPHLKGLDLMSADWLSLQSQTNSQMAMPAGKNSIRSDEKSSINNQLAHQEQFFFKEDDISAQDLSTSSNRRTFQTSFGHNSKKESSASKERQRGSAQTLYRRRRPQTRQVQKTSQVTQIKKSGIIPVNPNRYAHQTQNRQSQVTDPVVDSLYIQNHASSTGKLGAKAQKSRGLKAAVSQSKRQEEFSRRLHEHRRSVQDCKHEHPHGTTQDFHHHNASQGQVHPSNEIIVPAHAVSQFNQKLYLPHVTSKQKMASLDGLSSQQDQTFYNNSNHNQTVNINIYMDQNRVATAGARSTSTISKTAPKSGQSNSKSQQPQGWQKRKSAPQAAKPRPETTGVQAQRKAENVKIQKLIHAHLHQF